MSSEVLLAEAERLLAAHSPTAFDTSSDAFPDLLRLAAGLADWRGVPWGGRVSVAFPTNRDTAGSFGRRRQGV